MSSQSCIHNELLGALKELENYSPPEVSLGHIVIEELNDIMWQGLEEVIGKAGQTEFAVYRYRPHERFQMQYSKCTVL